MSQTLTLDKLRSQIREEVKKLPTAERLTILEDILQLIREDFSPTETSLTEKELDRELAEAAEMMAADYAPGGEMRLLTELDSDDFYDYEEE